MPVSSITFPNFWCRSNISQKLASWFLLFITIVVTVQLVYLVCILKHMNRKKPSNPERKLLHLPFASSSFFVHALWWRSCNLLCSRKLKGVPIFFFFFFKHSLSAPGTLGFPLVINMFSFCGKGYFLLLPHHRSPEVSCLTAFTSLPTASFLSLIQPNCTTKSLNSI